MGLDNPIHIAFLLVLVLLVFGAKRLPEMGRSLGSGMRGFKDALGGESTSPSPGVLQSHEAAAAIEQHATPIAARASAGVPVAAHDDGPPGPLAA